MKKPYRDLRIRREMATDYDVDFLRSLPVLSKVLPKLPKKIRVLLQRLQYVEKAGKE
ncbi:hypothetical protein J2Z31_003108 [Sinorhizobium kostiense]|uniref:Uncharacterized protein n=1 Tax=Sinorhizobium kostiense TaxID=76747 RepID=A0ABS4R2S8_9HYPH|nr:hypothetical protein [Sinorhizobium kostiense]MBP2236594.1 hypothetical protein [Sinorhizobium kostiense]